MKKNCERTVTPMIVGNWKMHNTIGAAIALVKEINTGLVRLAATTNTNSLGVDCGIDIEIVVAPPFTALAKVAEFLREHNSIIKTAAQNLFWEDIGAYTGEVSGMMIKDVGATHVIIGHSERRQYFYESDIIVNKKIKAAWRNQLSPIICVGETLVEHDANQVEEVISKQVVAALSGLVSKDDEISAMCTKKTSAIKKMINNEEMLSSMLMPIIIAYEPVWAIGTGKTATPQYAEIVHAFIRKVLEQNFGQTIANNTKILYGGSVKPDNSKELLMQPNIDGALIGGASLKAVDFLGIIENCV